MTKEGALRIIVGAIEETEKAISQHPASTSEIYGNGKRVFLAGAAKSEETEWSRSIGLSLSELTTMRHHLLASAFVSAWYELNGDKGRRDKAAAAACLLVAGLGLNPADAMYTHMQYEEAWRSAMSHATRVEKSSGCAGLLVTIIGLLSFAFLTRFLR